MSVFTEPEEEAGGFLDKQEDDDDSEEEVRLRISPGEQKYASSSGFSLMVTDVRTDIRTDRPSYRDARTHLKRKSLISSFLQVNEANDQELVSGQFWKMLEKNVSYTYRPGVGTRLRGLSFALPSKHP